jgi:hypothetical protein
MPLTPTTPDAICDRDAVSFVMLDGESFVRVDVERELLMRITSRRSAADHLAAVGQHRVALERIASDKYDRGDFRSFANSCVVPIGPTDLPH